MRCGPPETLPGEASPSRRWSTRAPDSSTVCLETRRRGVIVTITPERPGLTPSIVDALAQADIDGRATAGERALLEANRDAWIGSLWRLLDDAEEALASARRTVKGAARGSVLSDLDEECFRIDARLTALTGPPAPHELAPLRPEHTEEEAASKPQAYTGAMQLHLSRTDGRIVAWAAGHGLRGETHDKLRERLQRHGGGAVAGGDRARRTCAVVGGDRARRRRRLRGVVGRPSRRAGNISRRSPAPPTGATQRAGRWRNMSERRSMDVPAVDAPRPVVFQSLPLMAMGQWRPLAREPSWG